jgi:hypothetical protein
MSTYKEVTCYEAPDGSLYRTAGEAAAAALQSAIDTIGAVGVNTLKSAVADPHSADPKLISAISDLNELFASAALTAPAAA